MSVRLAILIFAGAAFTAFVALLALGQIRSGGQPASGAVNQDFGEVSIDEGPAADFSLERFDGETVSLSDLQGSVVLLDFWASWCPPCIEEAPALNGIYEEYHERGVEFLGVCIWDVSKSCEQFLEDYDVAYPTGHDAGGEILVDYGVKGIPEKFFIDREGRVARKFAGPVRDVDALREILDEMLSAPG